MNVQRYTWLDAVVEAETVGKISKEANTAHRLAHAITWEPSDGRPSGLYWANELAAEVCGVPRATFYRHLKVLKVAGFFVEEKGNLLPAIPESQNETRELFEQRRQALVDAYNEAKSHNETEIESQNEPEKPQSLKMRLAKSQNETAESQNDNPYSVDTYPVDEYTVEEKTTAPAAPVPCELPSNTIKEEDLELLEFVDVDGNSLNTEEQDSPLNLDVEDTRESQNETEEETNEEEAGMADKSTQVFNWNRENKTYLTKYWDEAYEIYSDYTNWPNATPGDRLDMSIKKAELDAFWYSEDEAV